MSVYVTGDIHGTHGIGKLGSGRWPEGRGLSRSDYLVVLGDFGLVWDGGGTDRWWLDWLEGKPWTTLFVDGNHENHALLASYPETEWGGGRVHAVRPHVMHLVRGHVFDLPAGEGGVSALAMGGAASHDMRWRVEGRSWWPEEVPSREERLRCESSLEARGWSVDLVLTHDAPARLVPELAFLAGRDVDVDGYERWLDGIAERAGFGGWWFGHYHMDRDMGDGFHVAYHGITRVA